MKIQGITENGIMAGIADVQEPKNEGIPAVSGDMKQPGDAGIPANQSKLNGPGNSDIPAELIEMLQNRQQQAGLTEFADLKDSQAVDMGNIKSRDLGNMLSGELVRLGEAVAEAQNPNVDFGDLPSRALTEMGKDVIKSE